MFVTAPKEDAKYISLRSDTGFKYVFKEKDNLKELLEDILNIKINSLDYLDSNLEIRNKTGKDSRLDILVKINEEIIVDIEMRQENKGDMLPRLLFYLAKIITKDLKEKDNYNKIKKYIMISIQDYKDNDKELQSSFVLTKNKKEEKDIIRFEKINLKSKIINNLKLEGWLKIFKEDKIEMKKYESEEEKIKKIARLLEELNDDPEALELYEVEEKRIRDEVALSEYNYEKGISKGISQGIQETKKASALNFYKNGVSKDLISKSLGLSMSELNSILLN